MHLVGRNDAVARARAWQAEGGRLLVVTGPGGIGKTTLARHLVADRPHRFIELAEVRDEEGWTQTLAAELGLDPALVSSPEAVVAALPETLVLDNVEQILDLAASAVQAWSERGARGVLVTSREPLGLRGEVTLQLGPLSRDAAAEVYRRAALEAGVEDPGDPGRLTAAVDGNPLALQMAGSRAVVATPDEIAAELASGSGLSASWRDGPDRHQSLDRLVGWSWDLCSPPEREALHRLGRVGGPLNVRDVRALLETPDPIAVVDRLRRRGLVVSQRSEDGTEVQPFELVRSWLLANQPALDASEAWIEHLCQSLLDPRSPRRRARLSRHLVAIAERALVDRPEAGARLVNRIAPELRVGLGSDRRAALFARAADVGNLSEAERTELWCRAADLVRSVGDHARAFQMLAGPLARVEDPGCRALLRLQRARILQSTYRDLDGAVAEGREAVETLAALGLDRAEHWRVLGGLLRMSGDLQGALDALTRGRALGRTTGDAWEEGMCLCEHALLIVATDSDVAMDLLGQAEGLMKDRATYSGVVATNRVLAAFYAPPELLRYAIERQLVVEDRPRKVSQDAIARAIVPLVDWLEGGDVSTERLLRSSETARSFKAPWIQAVLMTAALVRALEDGPDEARELLTRQRARGQVAADVLSMCEVLILRAEGKIGAARELADALYERHRGDDMAEYLLAVLGGADIEAVSCREQILARGMGLRRARFRIALDGSGFDGPEGPVDLGRRGPARRVLAALASGSVCSAEALIEAGWPGERLVADSARQRLWQTMRVLRRLGLEPVLHTVEDGYVLRDIVAVEPESD